MEDYRAVSETSDDSLSELYLTFTLGKEVFGIQVSYVTEIIGIQKITGIPDLPDSIKGIINLRGKVIPVMDLRARFKKEEIAYTEKTCIIIAELRDFTMGIIVDSVSEVMTIPAENIVDPPHLNQVSTSYLKKIGKMDQEIILLLDCENLLYKVNLDQMNEGERTA